MGGFFASSLAALMLAGGFGLHADDGEAARAVWRNDPGLSLGIAAYAMLLRRSKVTSSSVDTLVTSWRLDIDRCRNESCVRDAYTVMLHSVLEGGAFPVLRTKNKHNELIVAPLENGDLAVSLSVGNGAKGDGVAGYEVGTVATARDGKIVMIAYGCPLTLSRPPSGGWSLEGNCADQQANLDPSGLYGTR